MTDFAGGASPFVAADLGTIRNALDGIDLSAAKVSRSLTNAFAGAVVNGRSFEQTLQTIGSSLTRLALNAGLQPLQTGLTSMVGGMLSGFSGSITPFAEGGIVSRPTFFGSGSGLGLMGERGAEAIVPLSRGPDGRLGLSTQGAASPTSITVNISTPDADSFRRSQVQISGTLARAVSRGQRGL